MRVLWNRIAAGNRQKRQYGTRTGAGGFTLVELIVTLVVMVILCTMGIMGLSRWQDYADFKQQNEYARSVFSAAQIQLTQYAERGQLTSLKQLITNDGKADDLSDYLVAAALDAAGHQILDSDGNAIDPAQVIWEQNVNQETQAGTLYYLKADKGDYARYQQELKDQPVSDITDPADRRIRALFDMLEPYVSDKSILNAAILIEFDLDPKVAQVYSVFYDKKVDGFSYGDDGGTALASVYDRRESSRREKKVGYYGVSMLAKGTDTNILRPILSKVRLNDEATLNVSWSVDSDEALTRLVYRVNLYAAAEEENGEAVRVGSIVIGKADQSELVVDSDSVANCVYSRVVTDEDGNQTWTDQDMEFPLLIDRSGRQITLVLDALDLNASETASEETMKNSASFARLHLDCEQLYVEVSGNREGTYETTVVKKSNTENPLFGKLQGQSVSGSDRIYAIENVRHLNNIRFGEKKYAGSEKSRVYLMASNLDWNAALSQGQVWRNMVQVPVNADPAQNRMIPIPDLGSGAIFMSQQDTTAAVLKNFSFDAADLAGNTVGLFVENHGQIRNLTMEQVTVKGTAGADGADEVSAGTQQADNGAAAEPVEAQQTGEAAGAFCGRNYGTLYGLTVQSGIVTGGSHTGGIVGETVLTADGAVQYEKLVNRAQVTGTAYVGGIGGSLTADAGQSIYVSECENYGKVSGSCFIGGITGFGDEKTGGSLTISDCTSSPAYEDGEISDLVSRVASGEEALSGTFVGGIVGFNQGGSILNCNTLREQASTPGYVIGDAFVGGIVGFNAGDAGSTLTGGDKNNRNQANVIGNTYVGGITGCNAEGTLKEENGVFSVELKEEYKDTAVISNWINEGVVVASGAYCGGITGCNYGRLTDCSSNVAYTQIHGELAEVSSGSRFAGGIAGYNKGRIVASEEQTALSAVSVISGNDYVGGIVGYNDVGGQIDNYELKGGYITGNHFTGGYIGLNADPSVFTHGLIGCSPNEVNGVYFTGGIIGGNLIPVSGDLAVEFATDNFLGTLNAEQGAFAGGFIGYNYLLEAGTGEDEIFQAAQQLCGDFTPVGENVSAGEDQDQVLAGMAAQLETMLSDRANHSAVMTIRGQESGEQNGTTQTRLGGITSMVYVGGVIGYNQASSCLVIQDVENITPVTATASILRQLDGIGERRFSYAGGMIGEVLENVTLIRCRNRDMGEVHTEGTYTGGLAEINYGLIQECEAGSLGDGSDSYIGGLLGINMAKTTGDGPDRGIVDCRVSGTIMGENYVGGLVAENCGDIFNPTVESCQIEASGTHAGGIAGYGYPDSRIVLNGGTVLDLDIGGTGTNVGGMIGTNAGTVEVNGSEKQVSNGGYTDSASIVGERNVGGFIGVQQADSSSAIRLEGFLNYASVQAEEGYAGGIVARIAKGASGVELTGCENHGLVEVLSENEDDSDLEEEEEDNTSSAGGITAVNYGKIRNCLNDSEVRASNGYSGGITGRNYNLIANCQVGSGQGDLLELDGDYYVGGITAINEDEGVIRDSSVQNLLLQNQSGTDGGYMGGIAGANQGEIRSCTAGVEYDPINDEADYVAWHQEAAGYVSRAVRLAGGSDQDNAYSFHNGGSSDESSIMLTSNGAGTSMGGVAGINTGTIRGSRDDGNSDEGYSVVAAELRFAVHSSSYYGNLGGIAGVNEGTVSNYEFNGLIHGTSNNPARTPEYNPNYDFEPTGNPIYGYGGLAGFNGSDGESRDASITHCLVNYAWIRAIGDANNRANLGGAAGVNGAGASITDVRFGHKEEDVWENGKVQAEPALFTWTDSSDKLTYKGTVQIGAEDCGHAGGVAGLNLGEIHDMNDWDGYEQNRERYFENGTYTNQNPDTGEYFSDVDYTGVLVINNTGHSGGIVGYNRRTGDVDRVVTGRNWLVYAKNQGQDNGTGGIIGYNISDTDKEYCDNHSDVKKRAASSNAVGGFAGRIETSTSSSWRLFECRNYGSITANSRAGGMVGNWKYRGAILENCKNYGNIYAGSEGSAGMIGTFYGIDTAETFYINGCENHGKITTSGSNPAAGLAARVHNGIKSMNLNFSNCVNTGLIGGTGNSAGIIENSGNSSTKVNLAYCRNYGYSLNGMNSSFAGMSTGYKPASMTECFGVTDRGDGLYPIYKDAASTTKGAYYFAASDDQSSESFFWVDRVEMDAVNETITDSGSMYLMLDGARANDGNAYFKAPNGTYRAGNGTASYTFVLNEPVNITKLMLNWNRNATADSNTNFRFYEFQVEYLDEDGDSIFEESVQESRGDLDSDDTFADTLETSLGEDQYVSEIRISGIQAYTIGSNGAKGRVNAALCELAVTGEPESQEGESENQKVGVSAWNKTEGTKHAGISMKTDLVQVQTGDTANDNQYGIPLYISKIKNSEEYMARNGLQGIQIDTIGNHSQQDVLMTGDDSKMKAGFTGSYRLFLTLDPYLVITSGVEGLDIPSGIRGTDQGGSYLISWNAVNQAQYYEVRYTYYRKENGVEVKLGEGSSTVYQNQMPLTMDYQVNGVYANEVKIAVRAGARTSSDPSASEVTSDWSAETGLEFGMQLPMPQVHWELVNLNTSCYRVVLANKEDYEAFVEKNPGLRLEDIQISTKLKDGNEMKFTAAEGALMKEGAYVLQEGKSGSNQLLISEAITAVTGFSNSVKVIREAQLPGASNYTTNGDSNLMGKLTLERSGMPSLVGFFGSTADSLSYRVAMQSTSGWTVNYRTELVATDPDLGVPVSYAVSPQTQTSTTSTAASQIVLNTFPADFLDKQADGSYRYQNVYVQAYPTKMSNDIFYIGWQMEVPESLAADGLLTEEMLDQLLVTEDGRIDEDGTKGGRPLMTEDAGIAGSAGNRSLQPGYVLEYAGEGTYTLYYNTLLRELMKNGYQTTGSLANTTNNQKNTYMYRQVYYHAIDLETELANTQPKPVVYAEAKQGTDGQWADGAYDTKDSFVLTWDQPDYVNSEDPSVSLYSTDAVYRLTVTGVTAAGGVTTLVNNREIRTDTPEDGKINTCVLDARTWDYQEIRVSLERVGEVNANGVTQKFPSKTEKSFPMRRRLTKIGRPTITLAKNESGVVEKDGLNFEVTFTRSMDAEELEATAGYEITVTGKTSKKTAVFTVENSDQTSQKLSCRMDLSQFERGETIVLSVRAIAKESSTVYRDGLAGTEREMELPTRLYPPEMAGMTAEPSSDVILSAEQFRNGCLTLKMKPDSYTVANVQYEIAIQLFETAQEAEKANGTPVESETLELPSKDSPARMERTTENGEDYYIYEMKQIPEQYAGSCVKVVLRCVSDSNISSVWTDEDQSVSTEVTDENGNVTGTEVYEAVTPYRIWQLPKVKADEVTLDVLSADEWKSHHQDDWGYQNYQVYDAATGKPADAGVEVTAWQQIAAFETVPFAEHYQVMMVQNGQRAERATSSNAELVVSDVNELMIEKVGDGRYKVTYETTEGWDREEDETILQQIVEVGQNAIEIPYAKYHSIQVDDVEEEEVTNYIELKSALRAVWDEENQAVRFELLLPDFTRLTDLGDQESDGLQGEAYTEQLMVKALIEAENADSGIFGVSGTGENDADVGNAAESAESGPYTDSKWGIRVQEDLGSWTAQESVDFPEMSENLEPAGLSESGATNAVASNRQQIAFQVDDITGRTRYLAAAFYGDKELGVYAVPYSTQTSIDQIDKEIWLPSSVFAKYAGKTIELRFRSVFQPGSDLGSGMADGFGKSWQVQLPELPETESVSLTQQLSEEQAYSVAVQSRTRSLYRQTTTRKLYARQYQVIWNYPLSETMVDGYDLVIHGDNMDSDYRLKLNLKRNWLGQFTGLRDYMTEEGKLLYSVAYNLEGDMIPIWTEGDGQTAELASPSDASDQSQAGTQANASGQSQAGTQANASGQSQAGTQANASGQNQAGTQATPSNAESQVTAAGQTSTESQLLAELATASNADDLSSQIGVAVLQCRLKAELVEEDGEEMIRFTLMLPDASLKQLNGDLAGTYRNIYEDGLYDTERISVTPLLENRYYRKPEEEWYYVEKSSADEDGDEEDEMEPDSEDGALVDDVK